MAENDLKYFNEFEGMDFSGLNDTFANTSSEGILGAIGSINNKAPVQQGPNAQQLQIIEEAASAPNLTPEQQAQVRTNVTNTLGSASAAANPLSYGKANFNPQNFIQQQQVNQGPSFDDYRGLIDKGAGYLDPYTQAGTQGLSSLTQGLNDGSFSQGQFQYGGTGPVGQVNYQGQQPGQFNYGGTGPVGQVDYKGQQIDPFDYQGEQTGKFNYQGGPVDRSISSYTENDPGLAWQQEQLQKQIDRAGAAQGRWGGGATMRESMREQQGLLSQDYANRFNRAAMERGADVGAETDRYGRSVNQYGMDTQREQQGYQRQLTGYGLDNQREQEARRRGEYGTELARVAEQEGYGRDLTGYNQSITAEQEARRRGEYDTELSRMAEQQGYQRDIGQYGVEQQRLADQYNRTAGLAQMGQQAATAQGGMYSGLGSQLLGQQFQQQLANQQISQQNKMQGAADNSAMWSGLGGLVGGGLGLFLGGPAGAAAGATLGSTAGGMAGG
jgi:hypothetical protein